MIDCLNINGLFKTLRYSLFGLLLPVNCAIASELDDVTIQVLGLDEIPGSSLEIIDFPTAGISAQGVNEDIILHHSITDGPGRSDNILIDTVESDAITPNDEKSSALPGP